MLDKTIETFLTVAECGSMNKAAARLYRQAGVSDVGVKLIDGCRHEILNEDNHALVYADVWAFLEKLL